MSGNYEEAIKLYDKALALNSNPYMARLDKGRAELTFKLFKEALADFEKAIKQLIVKLSYSRMKYTITRKTDKKLI